MMLTVSSLTCRGAIGGRISIAEGSIGGGKCPQGRAGCTVGCGVAGAGPPATGVGACGPKGVGVAVALGSGVIRGLPWAAGAIKAPVSVVHAPATVSSATNAAASPQRAADPDRL